MKKRENNLPLSRHRFLGKLLHINYLRFANQNFQTVAPQFPVSPSSVPNAVGLSIWPAAYWSASSAVPRRRNGNSEPTNVWKGAGIAKLPGRFRPL